MEDPGPSQTLIDSGSRLKIEATKLIPTMEKLYSQFCTYFDQKFPLDLEARRKAQGGLTKVDEYELKGIARDNGSNSRNSDIKRAVDGMIDFIIGMGHPILSGQYDPVAMKIKLHATVDYRVKDPWKSLPVLCKLMFDVLSDIKSSQVQNLIIAKNIKELGEIGKRVRLSDTEYNIFTKIPPELFDLIKAYVLSNGRRDLENLRNVAALFANVGNRFNLPINTDSYAISQLTYGPIFDAEGDTASPTLAELLGNLWTIFRGSRLYFYTKNLKGIAVDNHRHPLAYVVHIDMVSTDEGIQIFPVVKKNYISWSMGYYLERPNDIPMRGENQKIVGHLPPAVPYDRSYEGTPTYKFMSTQSTNFFLDTVDNARIEQIVPFTNALALATHIGMDVDGRPTEFVNVYKFIQYMVQARSGGLPITHAVAFDIEMPYAVGDEDGPKEVDMSVSNYIRKYLKQDITSPASVNETHMPDFCYVATHPDSYFELGFDKKVEQNKRVRQDLSSRVNRRGYGGNMGIQLIFKVDDYLNSLPLSQFAKKYNNNLLITRTISSLLVTDPPAAHAIIDFFGRLSARYPGKMSAGEKYIDPNEYQNLHDYFTGIRDTL